MDKTIYDPKRLGTQIAQSIFPDQDGLIGDVTFRVQVGYNNAGIITMFPTPVFETVTGRMDPAAACSVAASGARSRFGLKK